MTTEENKILRICPSMDSVTALKGVTTSLCTLQRGGLYETE